MHGAVLHVYNFRDMPQSGIKIGKDSLVGEYSVIRGQGGVEIGDRVYTSPFTQIIAVNHVFDDPKRPFIEQGITAEGIVIEDDVILSPGSKVLCEEGVLHVRRGTVLGANSVLLQSTGENEIWAGLPARKVGMRQE